MNRLGEQIMEDNKKKLDMEKKAAAAENVDPEELDMVSGGSYPGRTCGKDYWCYYAYHHDSDDQTGACFHDYNCLWSYKCLRAEY